MPKKNMKGTEIKNELEVYKLIVEHSKEGIVKANSDLEIEFVNPAFIKTYGASSKEELIGRKLMDIVHPDDISQLIDHARSLSEKPIEFRVNVDSGSIWISATFAATYDSNKKLESVIVVGSDITDKKKLEQQLKDSEIKYRSIAENSPIGIVIIQDFKLVYYNNAVSKIIETSPDKLDKAGERFFELLHPEDRGVVVARYKSLIEGTTKHEHYTVRAIGEGKKLRWLLCDSSSIILNGKLALIGTIIDITEQKKLEQEKEQYISKLDKTNKELEALTRFITHDIGNALAPISYTPDILEKECQQIMDPEQYEKIGKWIDILRNSTNSAKHLLEDISNYVETKTNKYNFSKCNIYELLNSVIMAHSKQFDEANIRVDNKLPKDLEIYCDRDKLERVGNNCLSNASKYSKGPEYDNLVEIGVTEKDDDYEFYIKDNGIGIAEEDIPKLEIPYTRLKVKPSGGAGLGLASVKEIIAKHGGKTRIESEGLEKGSTFYFTIPKYPGGRA